MLQCSARQVFSGVCWSYRYRPNLTVLSSFLTWKYLQTAAIVDDPHQCVPYYSMSMWCAHKTQSQSVFVCVCLCVSWDRKAIVTFVQVCRCDITTPLLKNRFPRDHRYGINCALQCAVLVLTRKEENQGRKQKYLSSDWQKVNRMFLLHSRRHHAEQEDMM